MKRNIEPTQVERKMRSSDFIVSKTDTQGRITYGNEVFIEFSGYPESELIGTQHNIVRHPDMPRAVFKLLWDTIQAGKEISAYVKNMAKDGSYYWVFANVTPNFDEHRNIVGYYSVRRRPSPAALQIIEPLYRQMVAAERAAGARDGIAASTKLLVDVLESKGMTYDQLIHVISQ